MTIPIPSPSPELGQMRVLIPDDAAVFGDDKDEYLFTDEQLQTYLDIASGSVLRAAALAVSALATSEALISKVIKTQDLQTDGAKLSGALLAKAQELFKQAANVDVMASFDYFELVDYPGWNEYKIELSEDYLW